MGAHEVRKITLSRLVHALFLWYLFLKMVLYVWFIVFLINVVGWLFGMPETFFTAKKVFIILVCLFVTWVLLSFLIKIVCWQVEVVVHSLWKLERGDSK